MSILKKAVGRDRDRFKVLLSMFNDGVTTEADEIELLKLDTRLSKYDKTHTALKKDFRNHVATYRIDRLIASTRDIIEGLKH